MNLKRILSYKFQSLFIKNMLLNLILLAIPFMIIMLSITSYNFSIIKEQISELTLASLNRNIDLIDNIIEDLKYTAVVFENTAADIGFFNEIDRKKNDNYRDFVFNTLRPFIFSNKEIASISIYSEVKSAVIARGGYFDIETFTDKEWIPTAKNRSLSTPYLLLRKPFGHFTEIISIIKPVQNNKTGEFYGAVIIDTKINDVLNKDETLFSILSIVDQSDTIIFSDKMANIGKSLSFMDNAFEYKQLMSGEADFIYNNKGHYILLMNRSENVELNYFYKVPLSMFENRYFQFYRRLTFYILAILLLIIIASIFISLNNYRPIDNLLKIIEEPENSNLSLTKTKEIEEIASNIISSINKNKQLKDEMLDQLYLLDKTRIIALQTQINPHFLYNTLDAIRWKSMSLTNGENEVSSLISILAKLLRISLEGDDNTTTLQKELEHVSLFIEILNSRYENKFRFVIDMEEGLEEYLILKLSLQPILENACYHGIKPTRKEGLIKISGKRDNKKLMITIDDNGTGIEKIDELKREINKRLAFDNPHIGLRNVNQRIKLIFGEEYGLRIRSRKDEGTSIDLIFPLITDRKIN